MTIDEEYKTLNFLTYLAPVWYEVVIILIISELWFIPFNHRLVIMGILFVINILISKYVIRKLRKQNYIEKAIEEYDNDVSISSRYNNVLLWIGVGMLYLAIQIMPIVIFGVLS